MGGKALGWKGGGDSKSVIALALQVNKASSSEGRGAPRAAGAGFFAIMV